MRMFCKSAMPEAPIRTSCPKGAIITMHSYNASHSAYRVECDNHGELDNLPTWDSAARVQTSHNRTFHSGGAK